MVLQPRVWPCSGLDCATLWYQWRRNQSSWAKEQWDRCCGPDREKPGALHGVNPVTMRNCGLDLDCDDLAYAAGQGSRGAADLFARCCEGRADAGREPASLDVWISRLYDWILPDPFEREVDRLSPDDPEPWYARKHAGIPTWGWIAGAVGLIAIAHVVKR